MSSTTINNDAICDLQGAPLRQDAVTLLKALDRLLTVGAYYSAEHEQYLKAARDSRDTIMGVIQAGRPVAAIEITAQGLMIDRQNIDPNHRNVRLLHELLVPLNIGRLEIHAALTPEDLRHAIAVLQQHRMALGKADTFQEVVIGDLPDTVRAVSRSVLHQASEDEADGLGSAGPGTFGGGGDEISLDDLLDRWSEDDATAESPAPEAESENLARQFLEMVHEILRNLEQAERDALAAGADNAGTFVAREELLKVKRALERLVEVRPDPADLLRLISHARRALDLSSNPGNADLVFRILKRDMAGKKDAPRPDKPRVAREPEYGHTVDELLAELGRLERDAPQPPAPEPGARRDKLGIALHLMGQDPPASLRHALIEIVEGCLADPAFDERGVLLCGDMVASSVTPDRLEAADELLVLVAHALRQGCPDQVAPFWARALEQCTERQRPVLWPHLVNDILLGLGHAPHAVQVRVVGAAGNLPLQEALGLGRRLQRLAALQSPTASRDLFVVPPADLFPVLATLMMSPLKTWLGEEMFRTLRQNPPSPLVAALMAALDEHRPEYATFYLDLVRHQDPGPLPDDVASVATGILLGALDTLVGGQRAEGWVAPALAELAGVDPVAAAPLLERVHNERRFFFFKAWPEPARAVARRALAAAQEEG